MAITVDGDINTALQKLASEVIPALKDRITALEAHAPIETGTSGDWTYRKYADGTAEAWGPVTFSNVAITISSPSYGGYRSNNLGFTMPSIFNVTPNVVGVKSNSNAADLKNIYMSSSTAGNLFFADGISETIGSITVNLHANGRWK